MKRSFTVLGLVCIFILSMLAGCGNSAPEASSAPPADTASSEADVAASEEAATGALPFDGVNLSILLGNDVSKTGFEAVCALAEEKLGLTVSIEPMPTGDDGDNIVKTRLAAGEMTDMAYYIPGAKMKALNPADYFVDLSDQAFVDRLDDTYRATVTIDNAVYAIPYTSTQAGAILYSKPLYEKYNLEIPKTWDVFLANCQTLKDAGEVATYGSLADKWTSQLAFLGDNYNVVNDAPDFLTDFEAGTDKYHTNPVALRSFEKLADLSSFYNEDYLAATYDDGLAAMANAEAGHWLMLTRALSGMYELFGDQVNEVGVFPIPGDDETNSGLTVWMPDSIMCNKASENVDAVLAFMDLYISDDGLTAYSSAVKPDGPYCVKGFDLPEDSYAGVLEMQTYFDAGNTIPAAEFMVSVKGANCEAITQECTSGQTTGQEAAQKYDDDCYRQAVQLGLDWES